MAAVFVVVAASLTFPDPASAAASFDQSRDISSLPYLGQFEFGQHDVKGHVYQVCTYDHEVYEVDEMDWRITYECTPTNEPAFLTTLPD